MNYATDNDGKRKMDRCITRLVLGQPFYAALALRLKRVADSTSKTALWTDGVTLGFNPAKVADLRDDQIIGATCKLVEALAHQHHTRRESRDAKLWNQASGAICATIAQDCGFELPEDDAALASDEWKESSAESAYRMMRERQGNQDGDGNDKGDGDGQQDGQGVGMMQDGGGQGQGGAQGNGAGSGEIRDCPGGAADVQAAEQEWKAATFQAARIAQAQGNCPAHAKRLCDEITTPSVDWKQELRRFVSAIAHERYNWLQPNRRYAWQGIYMPSHRSREVGDIVLAIDTSGSIDDKILSQFASEVGGILEEYPSARLQVIYCDAAAYDGGVFTSQDCPLHLDPKGGGGTDFAPVFKWVDDNMDEPPKALVYLTDLYGDFPKETPDYPVLWGVCGGNTSEPPFGETVRVEID